MDFNIWKFGGRYSTVGKKKDSFIGDIFKKFHFAFFWPGYYDKLKNKYENNLKENDVILISDGYYLKHIALIDKNKFEKLSNYVKKEDLEKYLTRERVKYTQKSNFNLFKQHTDEFLEGIGIKLKCIEELKNSIYYHKVQTFNKINTNRLQPTDIDQIKNFRKKCIIMEYINRYILLLQSNKNLIFHGAPGTGKTYLAKQIAAFMVSKEKTIKYDELSDDEKNHIGFVQFHPSYDYTDFVEGLRPVKSEGSNEIGFDIKDGIFKAFCNRAKADPGNNYVFIIDEINRADISKVFGELFFALDPNYRGPEGSVKTQYYNMHGQEFYIPENVYIIGTMNDIDRSVDTFDFAIRRRFTWIELKVDETLIDRIFEGLKNTFDKNKAKKRLMKLNEAIENIEGLNSSYHIGPAYFLKLNNYVNDENPFDKLWNYHLEPLLREYLRGMPDVEEKIKTLKTAYNNES